MATQFLEAGSDQTSDLSFWIFSSGTVASATDQSYTGPRSIKLTSTPTVDAVLLTGFAQDTGTRISFRFMFSALPAAKASIFATLNGAATLAQYILYLNTNGTLNSEPVGATAATGTKVLAANTWYQISICYTITNTTTFRFVVYVSDFKDTDTSAGTLTNTASVLSEFLLGQGAGDRSAWFDDFYFDNGATYAYPGDIRVTAKRPFANGTVNNFSTQIGAGGSGYGSGHSPQVNERPQSTTSGWSMIGAGSAVTEEYNIENRAQGDVDLSRVNIVDFMGWLYAKSALAETGQIVTDGISSAIALTSTNTTFVKIAGKVTYPATTGADIGITTDTTLTTVSLYEAGILIAYTQTNFLSSLGVV